MLADEMLQQLAAAGTSATHVLVNCGVGGLATAVCSHLWAATGPDRPRFIVSRLRPRRVHAHDPLPNTGPCSPVFLGGFSPILT